MTTDSTRAPDAHHFPMTNRRAFLAAAPALAVLTAGPAAALAQPAITDTRAWDAAIRRMQNADAAYQRFRDTVFEPLNQRERAFEERHGVYFGKPGWYPARTALRAQYGTAHEVPAEINDELNRLCEAFCDAETAVMATPAPDLPALRWKLDKAFEPDNATEDDEGSTPCWAMSYVRQTIEDYRRLLGEA